VRDFGFDLYNFASATKAKPMISVTAEELGNAVRDVVNRVH
jgi:hypothetical protein